MTIPACGYMCVMIRAKSSKNKSFERTGKNIVCNTEALSYVIYMFLSQKRTPERTRTWKAYSNRFFGDVGLKL